MAQTNHDRSSSSTRCVFRKVHGCGNDFVIVDQRQQPRPLPPSAAAVAAIADRHTGVGCDQLIVLRARTGQAGAPSCKMLIFNADGSAAGACGNATRCVADLLLREAAATVVWVEGPSDRLYECRRDPADPADPALVAVHMGAPRFAWQDIPLAEARDSTLDLGLCFGNGVLTGGTAVSMGNPHVVFFVESLDAVDLAVLGPVIERDPLFPERTNVSVAHVQSSTRIGLKVWERGAGLTLACGTAACATFAAAMRRGLCGTSGVVEIILPGGTLYVSQEEANGSGIVLTGAVEESFTGTMSPRLARLE